MNFTAIRHQFFRTIWHYQAIIRRCREAGFEVHLTKPVDPEQLLAQLEA